MLAKEVMKENPITVSPDASVEDAAALMVKHQISGFPVVDEENRLVGVISEMDIMHREIRPEDVSVWTLCLWGLTGNPKLHEYQQVRHQWKARSVREIMTENVVSVDENDDLDKVGQIMFERRIKRVFVMKEEKLTGVISRSVFVRLLLKNNPHSFVG